MIVDPTTSLYTARQYVSGNDVNNIVLYVMRSTSLSRCQALVNGEVTCVDESKEMHIHLMKIDVNVATHG